MALDTAFFKTVLEHFSHGIGIFREGRYGSSNIAGRKDSKFVTQFSSASTGIRDVYDGCDIEVWNVFDSREYFHASGSSSDGRDIDLHLRRLISCNSFALF